MRGDGRPSTSSGIQIAQSNTYTKVLASLKGRPRQGGQKMKKFVVVLAMVASSAGILLSSLAAPAFAGSVSYDTTYAWNGSSSIQPFGFPNTATYGQTFVAPSGANVLENFTFYLDGAPGTTLDIQAEIFSWSGNMYGGNPPQGATGIALYTSSSFFFNGSGTFVPVTVNTGGVVLTPGQNYVALFTISNPADYANSNGTVIWGDLQVQHVAGDGGGGFNFYNNGSNYAGINTTPWDDFSDFGDSAWSANFVSGAPEPGAVPLLSLSLIGLALLAWKLDRSSARAATVA
jgi:hypothetical protein